MFGRIVEVAEDGRHLLADRGFLVVRSREEELGRVPLDDIGALLVHAHGVVYSNNLLLALGRRGASVVLCGPNHRPEAILWPVEGHHLQGGRMRAQAAASLPLQKRLWQSLVKAKVAMQGAALEAERQAGGGFDLLARKVRSGDPDNVEAQAARRYWPLMMGKDFRRDSSAGGANAMLNYGYTVLRAATARAVMAAGLHPTFGLAHRNRSNPMPLVDDLMEPFRPMADRCVLRLLEAGHAEVTPEAKAYLAAVTNLDMEGRAGIAPLSTCLERLAASLAAVFEGEARALELPRSPLPLSLPPPPAANLAGEDPC